MEEYTNKIAFDNQMLQEAPECRAAIEQVCGGRAGYELFQGWALARWGYLGICFQKEQGGWWKCCVNLQAKSTFIAQCQSYTQNSFINWN